MPIDPLPVWKVKFAEIPPDPTGQLSPILISAFVAERVTGKLIISPTAVEFQPPPTYAWVPTFLESTLRSLAVVPSVEPITPNTKIAQAWSQGCAAAQLIITPGAKMNPPPPGTNGIVATAAAVIDPASLTAATTSLIQELIAAPPAGTPATVVFPEAMFKAFTKLKYVITGLDTKPPPSGPIPFTFPQAPVF